MTRVFMATQLFKATHVKLLYTSNPYSRCSSLLKAVMSSCLIVSASCLLWLWHMTTVYLFLVKFYWGIVQINRSGWILYRITVRLRRKRMNPWIWAQPNCSGIERRNFIPGIKHRYCLRALVRWNGTWYLGVIQNKLPPAFGNKLHVWLSTIVICF